MNLTELAKKQMPSDWLSALSNELDKEYFKTLEKKLTEEEQEFNLLPSADNIFNAFKYAPLEKITVVILGQDPSPNPEYAHGLCFSVREEVTKYPMSLRNIFKELDTDLGVQRSSGCLKGWAEQGVFLLNGSLTVREGKPLSHSKYGWKRFTDKAIEILSNRLDGVVFILLGDFARNKKTLIDEKKHFVIESVHPSPLSARRGFFGSHIFSRTNNILHEQGKSEINFLL